MTLSDFSIKNPVFAWMLMIGIIVFGWIGFDRLGVSQLPDVDFPVVSVAVTWEGAAPEVMETEVTDVIEDAVMSVEGIKEVISQSQQGYAQITIEFDLDRDIDAALQEVQTKIAQAQRTLPRDIDPPIVTKTNPEDQPIMWIALSGDVPLKELTHYVNEFLKDQFTTVKGVGNIFMGGYIPPNLRVWLDAKKMQEKEFTVEDILNTISFQHAELPAGYISAGPKEINVRVYGEAATPKQFEDITIHQRVRGGPMWKQFRIGDVGTVEDGLADIRRISRSWGQTAIGMGLVKQRGTNAVTVAKAVKQRIAEIEKILPPTMRLRIVFDATQFIKESVHELEFNLILSVILTSLVCWFFLGSLSATINVLLSIPTSLMGAFFVMYFSGFTINTFTMLGLSLVIGIVVDDSIMVLENISRYQEQGMTRREAALVGAREITFAALAASVAILAIFVPVIFMEGIIGRFFFQFGVTISVAVMFSLVEALTITPMRCARFLKVGHTTRFGRLVDSLMHASARGYRWLLTGFLKARFVVLILAAAVFLGSVYLLPKIKKEFVPAQDQGRFRVKIMMPLGSSIENTDAAFRAAEDILMKRPEVEHVFCAVGSTTGGQVNQGFMMITMKPREERPPSPSVPPGPPRGLRPAVFKAVTRLYPAAVNWGSFKGWGRPKPVSQQEFMVTVRKELSAIPGVDRVVVQDLSLTGFTAKRGFPVEFTVQGPDWDKLGALSTGIMQRMKDSGMMSDIDTDYQLGMPELQVYPDRFKAAKHGVSVLSVADTINAMIGGIRMGKFTSRGKRYDIRIRLAEADRTSPKDVQKMWVRNQFGEVVALGDVVTTEVKPTLFSITRKNRERAVTVYANPSPGHSQQEALSAVEKIAKETLPDGYHIVFSGGAQAFQESFRSLIFVLVLGIFVAYMILGTQFNSFVHPVTVLLALPFSATGAFAALYYTQTSLNLYSMIGLILLMGIVKKNSIMLVDFTNVRREKGMGVREALLDACPTRLRPILMTSITVIAAAVPPALAVGPGAETMVPMALTVIGGVTFSTVLTLFVVPCAYEVFSKFERHDRESEDTRGAAAT
ncbi:MAG TPA: efflux RND transporter permease subunit [bacterium]|nr:efflux RND transporter permease subunit [bacterium]